VNHDTVRIDKRFLISGGRLPHRRALGTMTHYELGFQAPSRQTCAL
jgi:hypothetical protein